MSLPFLPNTTCDIYHTGNAPPAAPDVPGVQCYLIGDFYRRTESGEGDAADGRFTHTMLVALATDVRDDYDSGVFGTGQDTVFVPDKNGTEFDVRFVEVKSRNTPGAHKKVYLDRCLPPSWPTSDL
ncbi:MAG TPA: hypothetical protein VE988_30745 [Gemmataceae bacterium]|nr:hypothetical protein [Gemmataceae bacterium]